MTAKRYPKHGKSLRISTPMTFILSFTTQNMKTISVLDDVYEKLVKRERRASVLL